MGALSSHIAGKLPNYIHEAEIYAAVQVIVSPDDFGRTDMSLF